MPLGCAVVEQDAVVGGGHLRSCSLCERIGECSARAQEFRPALDPAAALREAETSDAAQEGKRIAPQPAGGVHLQFAVLLYQLGKEVAL